MPVTRRRRRYTMLWFGLFLVSVTVIDSSYFVRQRDIALNTKNSSFHSGVPAVSSGERQLTPATGSRDSGRRRQDEYTERRDWIESMSRRHRRSKRQNGICQLFFCSVISPTLEPGAVCVGVGGNCPKPRPYPSPNVTRNTVWRTQSIGI